MASNNSIYMNIVMLDNLKEMLQNKFPKIWESAPMILVGKTKKYGTTLCHGLGGQNKIMFKAEVKSSRKVEIKSTNNIHSIKLEMVVETNRENFASKICSIIKSESNIKQNVDAFLLTNTFKITSYNELGLNIINFGNLFEGDSEDFNMIISITLTGIQPTVIRSTHMADLGYEISDWNMETIDYQVSTKTGINNYRCAYFPDGNPEVEFQINMFKMMDTRFELSYTFKEYFLCIPPKRTYVTRAGVVLDMIIENTNRKVKKINSDNDSDIDDNDKILEEKMSKVTIKQSKNERPQKINLLEDNTKKIKAKNSIKKKTYEDSEHSEEDNNKIKAKNSIKKKTYEDSEEESIKPMRQSKKDLIKKKTYEDSEHSEDDDEDNNNKIKAKNSIKKKTYEDSEEESIKPMRQSKKDLIKKKTYEDSEHSEDDDEDNNNKIKLKKSEIPSNVTKTKVSSKLTKFDI